MKTTIRVLNTLLNAAAIAALIALVILTFANVVMRYFLNTGITWGVEVSGHLFVWLIFLGATIAFRDHGHLGVDVLVAKAPLKVQKLLFIVINAIIIAVLLLFLKGLWVMIQLNAGMTGSATPIPVNVMYAAGVVGAVLMILISIAQTIRFVLFNKDAPPWSAISANGAGVGGPS